MKNQTEMVKNETGPKPPDTERFLYSYIQNIQTENEQIPEYT